MTIDLARIPGMHLRVPADLVLALVKRAAFALERNGHESGVSMALDVGQVLIDGSLSWQQIDLGEIDQHDHNRITEDGAEAVALAVVSNFGGWRVVRRMQREEHADWLLDRPRAEDRELAALEVSGVDRGGIAARLAEKVAQVSNAVDVHRRMAVVVGFERPVAALRIAQE